MGGWGLAWCLFVDMAVATERALSRFSRDRDRTPMTHHSAGLLLVVVEQDTHGGWF